MPKSKRNKTYLSSVNNQFCHFLFLRLCCCSDIILIVDFVIFEDVYSQNIVDEIRLPNTYKPTAVRFSSADAKLTPNNDAPVEMENPYKKERRQCILCKLNIKPDYKNYRLLSQFQSPYTGRIYGRHITGLCKAKQALVENEIKKAQNCAYMPYYYKDKVFLKDPKLFDPENPIRSHRF